MNHHPLHTDAWFAETQTQFGKNVVVGNLVYSLVLGMSVPDVSGVAIANLEVESLQHKKPTFHGDTIYAETKVLEKKESQSKPDRGVVSVETRGFNQRGDEVCYFRRRVMVPEAGGGPAPPPPVRIARIGPRTPGRGRLAFATAFGLRSCHVQRPAAPRGRPVATPATRCRRSRRIRLEEVPAVRRPADPRSS